MQVMYHWSLLPTLLPTCENTNMRYSVLILLVVAVATATAIIPGPVVGTPAGLPTYYISASLGFSSAHNVQYTVPLTSGTGRLQCTWIFVTFHHGIEVIKNNSSNISCYYF
ncbi:uncharacterized protein [Procambarus clarkii]|uniref:uncharacterized protein isoform X1 n=1 Tax=Procambarus clarkii TaxID=6728 RepID=UPI003742056B